ncbi:MAG TPA: ester cyclase [Candidatus Sulfotelmatobacter sp.]|nr:ester cyclase [Candidatus Sulfotelmatobacter sp.]
MPTRRTMLAAVALSAPALIGSAGMSRATAGACDHTTATAALLDRYVAAVNANDAAALARLFATGYIQHGGIKGVRDALPDLHLTVDDRIFGDDKIVARNRWTGTHRGPFLGIAPTGKTVTIHTIDIWRVADGKLAEHWDVIDIAGVEQQLRGG